MRYFEPSTHHSFCGWKGTASYYTLNVNGERNEDAAWFYPDPYAAARKVKGRVGFWKGVRVEP